MFQPTYMIQTGNGYIKYEERQEKEDVESHLKPELA